MISYVRMGPVHGGQSVRSERSHDVRDVQKTARRDEQMFGALLQGQGVSRGVQDHVLGQASALPSDRRERARSVQEEALLRVRTKAGVFGEVPRGAKE